MTFTVKYRAIDGKMREECIEAASRSECVAKCKAQGVAPISVKEGGKVFRRTDSKVLGGKLLWIIAGVVILGGICWWFFGRQVEAPLSNVPHTAKISSSKKAKNIRPPSVVVPENKSQLAKNISKKGSTNNASRMYMGSPVIRVEASTNSAGYLVERLYTADGKRHKFTHYPPPVFKHASDSYLAMALSVPVGAEMAPLPDLSNEGGLDKAFMESLKEDIFIEDGDSERIKDLKVKVVAARETMKALLKEGYSFVEVLEDTRKNINENVELRAQMTAQYHDLLQKGFSEDAESLRIKVNKVFAEMGIEDIQPRKNRKSN